MDIGYVIYSDSIEKNPWLKEVQVSGFIFDHLIENANWRNTPKFIVNSGDLYVNLVTNYSHLFPKELYFGNAWVKIPKPKVFNCFFVYSPGFNINLYKSTSSHSADKMKIHIEEKQIWYVFNLFSGETNLISPNHVRRLLEIAPNILSEYNQELNQENKTVMLKYIDQLNTLLEGQ